jgi:hypothetical protein
LTAIDHQRPEHLPAARQGFFGGGYSKDKAIDSISFSALADFCPGWL